MTDFEFDILQRLTKVRQLKEISHKTSFVAYRRDSMQQVFIDILDRGPDFRSLRYTVEARTEDGRLATGNPAESLDVAIAGTHWDELDRKP